ncbi:TauD/TfdA family dioxygenase [Chelativorans sp. ZYF759]|uniref:TauD/TfdA dioxygenase family protein n=1 Tax=Chelativorans sp. ZYF759 TaxID=2692213 RepID=UPI00145C9C79|nr:TauD/TfdA family dioxygenase [Chelativorans sp. ZYF759]NMG39660.1 TauD/TfdA family dioxygenase [Chelativorans sp. ZYF759]
MTLTITQLHKHFVGEAAGVDLSQPLDAGTIDEINRAMDTYAVLVFRDQPLTQTQQLDLARSFGPLDMGLKKLKKQPDRLEHAELADISNVGDAGGTVARDSKKIVSNIANQLWHSDSSFQQPAARYSMLAAVQVPSSGGDTEFADLRAAYDGLPEEMKTEIEGLEAEHYALHSRFLLGDTDYTEEQKAALPPVWWPLVRTHPGSGRKILFAGIHARSIKGWTVAEGRMLLMDMLEHATQPEYVYAHKWRPNDLVIWDNRATLHRGRRFDLSQPRELRRATTLDVGTNERAAA